MLASFNHCRSMKAENRQIPQKLADRLKLVLLSSVCGRNHCCCCFPQIDIHWKNYETRKGRIDELPNNNKAVFGTRKNWKLASLYT